MFSRLFGKKPKAPAEEKQHTETVAMHTVEVRWDNWSPPGEKDGTHRFSGTYTSIILTQKHLANHGILPHSGKDITKAVAVEALTKAFNVDPKIANVFAASGIFANPNHDAHSFDLNHVSKHNYIEHDASLSRDDAAFGGGEKFHQESFDMVLKTYREAHPGKTDDEIMTDWMTAGHARWARVLASKQKHDEAEKTWIYGIKEAIMSYGETSLYLNLLGKDGVAPLKWVKIFFEQERLPHAEGWRPPTKFDQADLNHGYSEMMKGGEHGVEEAKLVGIGTLVGLKAAIMGLGASFIKAPSAH
ncbi:uncharacterized protein N0V89_005064 [Didymosphaeria variabile]|uniref:Heme haloperoxidase family profile domain-containing protein n=1 Tax=Didymosphaeria variabile TaxID=1932322 RepID=A0A9W8XKP2_9PLEO|nr:uncharacterized protein N0V89_005064 [Didymosphaeria variabile]KAJ4353336.1 hypothetical protein N0V89_005064 [Didymosphaeria variabile]